MAVALNLALPPKDAVDFFNWKEDRITWDWHEMLRGEHELAFTVAKATSADVLGAIRGEIAKAVGAGQTFEQFKRTLKPRLMDMGWWGRQDLLDGDTGEVTKVQLGSDRRLRTIYDTNIQTAYQAGRYKRQVDNALDRPFWQYIAVMDGRTRQKHADLNNKVFRWDDPIWRIIYPPNGFGCRCRVRALNAEQVAKMGLPVESSEGMLVTKEVELGGKPVKVTGLKGVLPGGGDFYPDVGWDYNPGDATAAKLRVERLAEEKALKAKQAATQAQAQATAQAAEEAAAKAAAQAAEEAAAEEAAAAAKAAEVQKAAEDLFWAKVAKKAALDAKKAAKQAEQAAAAKAAENAMAKAAQDAAAKTAPTPAPTAVQPKKTANKATAAVADAGAPNPATMRVVGVKPKGSNDGAIYEDTSTGTQYMVKFMGKEDIARNEVLAGRLYNLAGVDAPDLHLVKIDGKTGVASKLIDGIKEVDAETLAANASVQEGFAVDAWLSNWDVVGTYYDNIVLAGGKAVRIDVGGSLRYRALGDLKGKAFGARVTEIDTLRDQGVNRQSWQVFGDVSQAQIEAGVRKVLSVSDEDIRRLVGTYGPKNEKTADALAATLIARKQDLAQRFPGLALAKAKATPPKAAVSTVSKMPDEQALIEASGANGYALEIDGPDIEDHQVHLHVYTKPDGSQGTRAMLRLMPNAGQRALSAAKTNRWDQHYGLEYNTAKFAKGKALETTNTARALGAGFTYSRTLADGSLLRLVPDLDESITSWSMKNIVLVDVPGAGAVATQQVLDAIKTLGVETTRATLLDRQHLYLNAFARMRICRLPPSVQQAYAAIGDVGADAIQRKLEFFKSRFNLDVQASAGWQQAQGLRSSTNTGRTVQLRPDLDTAEFAQFEQGHYLYHNPKGLGKSAGAKAFERLKRVITGGGQFAPQVDRIRRGIELAGESVSKDMASGGGNYHFTRIAKRDRPFGTGVYWRAKQLKRMDVVTYDADRFGRTTPGTFEDYRMGQYVEDFVEAAKQSDNESIFKGGLSLFDDVDRIVLANTEEVDDAIKWMSENGYETWPDGRKLDEVIITKDAHTAGIRNLKSPKKSWQSAK